MYYLHNARNSLYYSYYSLPLVHYFDWGTDYPASERGIMPNFSPAVQNIMEVIKANYEVFSLLVLSFIALLVLVALIAIVTHLPVRDNKMVVTLSSQSIEALATAIILSDINKAPKHTTLKQGNTQITK